MMRAAPFLGAMKAYPSRPLVAMTSDSSKLVVQLDFLECYQVEDDGDRIVHSKVVERSKKKLRTT